MRQILRESIPDAIGGLIASAVLALLGLLWRRGLLSVALAAVYAMATVLWLVCAYVAFKRAKPNIVLPSGRRARRRPYHSWRYPRLRRWALVGLGVVPFLVASHLAYQRYASSLPPTKLVVLVADFDGPDPRKYRVTETVLNRLKSALAPYEDVQVLALGRSISEAEGSAVAIKEGKRRRAAVVIWGWYGGTEVEVPVSVNFEPLVQRDEPPPICAAAQGEIQTLQRKEFESFSLQTTLSDQLAYLTLFTVGYVRYMADDYTRAIDFFDDALAYEFSGTQVLSPVNVYYYRGYSYLSIGDNEKAMADLDRVIEMYPKHSAAYYCRGKIRAAEGKIDAAIDDLVHATSLDPQDYSAYASLGDLYMEKGDLDSAIAVLDQAIAINGETTCLLGTRGMAYLQRGDYDLAMASFNRVTQMDPGLASPYTGRGAIHYLRGYHQMALGELNRAIEINPADEGAYAYRGMTYQVIGETGRAIVDYRKALSLTDDPVSQGQLTTLLRQLGVEEPY